ncbi:MAG TPA: glycoside hydrolase family 3 N-terminal domain-containing protein [Jatrophihabitans sp.]|nr:glycoside hydrolase family 3 N-terminal domain-containing protein [Jatrophihabitans sp.]
MSSIRQHSVPRWLAPVGAVLLVVGVTAATVTVARSAGAPHNRQSVIDRKVNRLLAKMTLREKFGQLEQAGPDGANGAPGPQLLHDAKAGLVGSVLDLVGVKNINRAQHAAMQSRLHIPLIFSLDVIHGYRTIFPVPLMEASSWDLPAITRDEAVSAREATADGIKWTFNPMVDISRDPRWGRVVEGAGEDPYLGSAVAAAKVRGYQGRDFGRPNRMAATVKHFAAYGAPVAGREYNTVDMSTQQLLNDYLPPYRAAVGAGVATVMSSFNSLNGVPASGNPYLLQHILRQMWDFKGAVVSDYQAIQELVEFGYAANEKAAARLALTAGVDIEMAVQVPSVNSTYLNFGPQLVRSGKISIAEVNSDVRHVLRLKYLAGMFAHPYVDPTRVQHAELTKANLAAARAMADESSVLLRNDNALPLPQSTSSIAVVGPLADDAADQLGPDVPIGQNTIAENHTVTVLHGIKNAVPNATVTYAQGCDATCTSDAGFPAAVAAANAAQRTVVVVGEPASYSGEASSRSRLGLPGKQLELVKKIAATGLPYVVVLMNGRPLTIDWLATHAPGLLEAWYPGTEGGNAVADVLFGSVNPSGKLPMSFPRDVGQIPIYYDQLPTGRPADPNNKYTSKYLDVPNTPQYPFGYGLSYTSFKFSNLRVSPSPVSPHGVVTVRADITNTGSRAGADVAQLYIRDKVASILQPVRRLDGFHRVNLAPGKTRTVTFHLRRPQLGFYDNAGRFVVEPGRFDVWVGDSSVGGVHGGFAVR